MTIGSGGPYVPTHAGARNALPNIRNLINQGKYADAESAINANILGNPQQQSVYPTIPSDLSLRHVINVLCFQQTFKPLARS